MKKTSTIYYTFEDTSGSAETFNKSDFNKIVKNEEVIGAVMVELIGENESIEVPMLKGYRKPYDSDMTDDIGTEHYIYYEEEYIMNKELREQVIGRLEIMRGHGQFDEFEEETMDFNKCSDEELQYYNYNWITGQFDDEKITTTTIEGYFTEDQANKIRERMQGKTYLNFNVDYSNQNGNCKLIVSTDYYEENDYNTKEEFEQVLHDDFMYFALQEMI